jgi:iron complex outermembrane receptor protein
MNVIVSAVLLGSTSILVASLAPAARAQELPAAGEEQQEPRESGEEEEAQEEIIVQGTRTRRRVQDEPIRVEVITREEIEEKLLMRPGNIAMLVNETGGVRVQVTSPALGAANIRVQGMEGRYTQLLADGLPLYGWPGLLARRPADPADGSRPGGDHQGRRLRALPAPRPWAGSSTSCRGGLARRSRPKRLANATTRSGQDLTAYAAAPLGTGWSASVTGGAHRQSRHDLDDDGWIDIPFYERWTARRACSGKARTVLPPSSPSAP